MKILNLLLTGILTVCFSLASYTQEFEIPSYSLEAKEDYAKYEQDVIKAAGWLESNAIGKDLNKRTEINAFVMKWITGSPTVSMEIYPLVTKLYDKNPQLLGAFMASYARYSLQNNYSKDVIKSYVAGVSSMIKLYNLGGEVKKNKTVLKAMEAEKAGTLEAWVTANYKK